MTERIYIFSQPIRSGKTTALLNWLKTKRILASGILTPDVNRERKLYDIREETFYPFEAKPGDNSNNVISIGKFVFYKTAFAKAKDILITAFDNEPDWIIIDEIGKLEIEQNEGLEPFLSEWISAYKENNNGSKLLLVIRDSLLNKALEKYILNNCTIIDKAFFDE